MKARRIQLIAIAAGGMAGALTRIALLEAFPTGEGFPWATLAVNVAGAALLGAAAALTLADAPHSGWRLPLVGTGFCGALTTFSGLCIETLDLLDAGKLGVALGYVAASVAIGLPAAALAGRIAGGSPGSRR